MQRYRAVRAPQPPTTQAAQYMPHWRFIHPEGMTLSLVGAFARARIYTQGARKADSRTGRGAA